MKTEEKVVDKYKLYRSILVSWFFTLMGLFNLAAMCGLAMFIAIRVRGPAVVVSLIVPTVAIGIFFCLIQEVLVNFLFSARAPDPENESDRRFAAALKSVAKKAHMWVTPRAWVLHGMGDVKNAMTYGLPVPGLAAIAITRDLVAILEDDELEAVIAHECGHIKCRDTAVLFPVSLLLSFTNQMYSALKNGKSLWTQSPVTLVAGWAVYLLGKCAFAVSQFSISQEREFSADALAVLFMGSSDPVARLLKKLLAEQRKMDSGDPVLFEDLMTSHPGLEERISEVESLMVASEGSV